VNGFHLPTSAKLGDARVAEDGREQPRSKKGITSTGKPCSGFGISVVFTPHTPQGFDSGVQVRVSLFCGEIKQANSLALQMKSEEVRRVVLSLQPSRWDV